MSSVFLSSDIALSKLPTLINDSLNSCKLVYFLWWVSGYDRRPIFTPRFAILLLTASEMSCLRFTLKLYFSKNDTVCICTISWCWLSLLFIERHSHNLYSAEIYGIFQNYMNGNDAEVRPHVRMCYSKYSTYFEWTIYIIEGALLSFGAFLAWETRRVCIIVWETWNRNTFGHYI